MTLEIPVIPDDLLDLIDHHRGSLSREEYVLIILQNEVMSEKARIYA